MYYSWRCFYAGPCYYVGNGQGGRTAEREENESVIEGRYTDYQVQGLFDDKFAFSQFEKERCTEAAWAQSFGQ